MIEYGLYENHLTPNPGDYWAQVQNLEVIDQKAILNEMVVPGGVTKAQAAAVLTAEQTAVKKILLSGKGVMTNFCEIRPGIRGVFINKDDVFDPKRHTVVLNARLRKDFRDLARDIKVKKVAVSERVPVPQRFVDTATQQRDEVISNGMVGELKGSYLKFDPADSEQGVFVIKADGSALRCDNYIHNTASKLLFYVPGTLTVGEEVELEVRNKVNNTVKNLRSGSLATTLTVV
jgi:hypothetical protein